MQRHDTEERAFGRQIARGAAWNISTALEQHFEKCQSMMTETARHPVERFDHPSASHGEMESTWLMGETVDLAKRWRDKSFPLPSGMRQAFLAE